MIKTIYLTLFIAISVIFLAWSGYRVYCAVQFDRGCEGYLKRAADANTVEMAKKQLKIAVDYCEAEKLTSGYTSIWYTTPDEDIEFWYNNLKSSLIELNSVSPNASQLETSNVLMKLRETLLDNDGDGTTVTSPAGISIYPYNKEYMWKGTLSFILALLFGIGTMRHWNDD